MADVFISYWRGDQARAELVRTLLESLGLEVFFDRDRLNAGDDYADALDRHLKSAKAVIALWSPGALQSRWVKLECEVARERGRLLPAAIDAFATTEVPAQFKDLHFVNIAGFNGEPDHAGWQELIRALALKLERPELVAAAANATLDTAAAKALRALIDQLNVQLSQSRTWVARLEGDLEALKTGAARNTQPDWQVVNLKELPATYWTNRQLASRLVSIDYAAYEHLTEKDEGTIEHWKALIDASPQSWTLLLMPLANGHNLIVGSWSVFSIKPKHFKQLRTGSMRSDNIKPKHLRTLEPGGEHFLFFDNISLHPEIRAAYPKAGELLTFSIVNRLRAWMREGFEIKEVIAHQYAEEGVRMADQFGLAKGKRNRHYAEGAIYAISGEELRRRFLRRS